MSLFVCDECQSVDNTATSGFWTQGRVHPEKRLCSACNPEMGKWHDRFPRQKYDGTQGVTWKDGGWVVAK